MDSFFPPRVSETYFSTFKFGKVIIKVDSIPSNIIDNNLLYWCGIINTVVCEFLW